MLYYGNFLTPKLYCQFSFLLVHISFKNLVLNQDNNFYLISLCVLIPLNSVCLLVALFPFCAEKHKFINEYFKTIYFSTVKCCAYLGWTRNRRGKQYIVSYRMARIDVDIFMLIFSLKTRATGDD